MASRVKTTAISLAVAGAFAGGISQAHASAFALIEQSASGLGSAFSGAAAAAEDASTIYYNPAGMSLLPAGIQVSAGLAFINISTKFSDSGSQPSGTALGGVNPAAPRPLGGAGGDAGGLAAVPNLYVKGDIAPTWKVGLGLSVPFGLQTEYEPDWIGRFQAIKSELDTLNVNPSVAYKVNDKISVGGGVSYQQINAELSSAVNYVALVFAAAGAGAAALVPAGNAEGTVKITGDDNALGWNLGAMFAVAPETRLGVSYRSAIKYKVTGSATFSNAPTALTGNLDTPVSLHIEMPDSASVALQQKLGANLALLGDVTWTHWSRIQDLTIERSNGSVLNRTPENFRNTWRIGVGATNRLSDAWSLKLGVAYDRTPVNDTDRTPRLPDQDRTWLSFGGQYRSSQNGTLDLGYAHLFVKQASINQNAGNVTAFGLVSGNYKSSIDIFGAQFTYRF
jgi:long-chain fatty acid transport protein